MQAAVREFLGIRAIAPEVPLFDRANSIVSLAETRKMAREQELATSLFQPEQQATVIIKAADDFKPFATRRPTFKEGSMADLMSKKVEEFLEDFGSLHQLFEKMLEGGKNRTFALGMDPQGLQKSCFWAFDWKISFSQAHQLFAAADCPTDQFFQYKHFFELYG